MIEHLFHTDPMARGSGRGVTHPVPATPPARQHCWVTGPSTARGPHPGLVVRWQQESDASWKALVVYLVEADDTLVQQWLPADMLIPIARA